LAAIRLHPIRYLPTQRSLYLATTIEATLTYNDAKGSAARMARSQQARARREIAELVSNPQDIDRFAPAPVPIDEASTGEGASLGEVSEDTSAIYLLITSEALAPTFQPLVDRRTAQGKTGKLVTTEWIYANYDGTRPDGGQDDQTRIRNCIIDHYENHGTAWVCLAGDDTVIPLRYTTEWDTPTDLYYGALDGTWDGNANGVYGEDQVDGTDSMTEVRVGRVPVRTTEQAEAYVNKVSRYENRSPDEFAGRMLLGSSFTWYMSGLTRPTAFWDHDPVDEGEWPMRTMYREAIQPYWQPTELGELFNTFSTWDDRHCGDYGMTYDHMVNRLNHGYHHIWLWGHGGPGGGAGIDWSMAAGLLNSEQPSIIYSTSCSTAALDLQEPCCSEAFLRADGGAVAYIGGTRAAGMTDYHARLFYEEVLHNRRSTIGEAFATAMNREPLPRIWDYFALCLQADPALTFLGDESGRHLQILSPKGCEVIDCEADITVRWNAAGSGFDGGEQVKLEYSADGGESWLPIPGAENRPYNGRLFIWENPGLTPGTQCRVRVTSLADPSVSDVSAHDFTIADVKLLTAKSIPISGFWVAGTHANQTNYTFTLVPEETVSLTAPIAVGYNFLRWADANGSTLTRSMALTFVCSGNKAVTAEYAPVGSPRDYYVNDDTAEDGFAPGDDENDGLTPATPVRHIQQILDRYDDIATIHVSAGTYRENVVIAPGDSGLVIEGAGPEYTVIDGGQAGSCVSMYQVGEVTIKGCTIRNGRAHTGAGVYAHLSGLTMENCYIEDNEGTYGGGFWFWNDSGLVLRDCVLSGNRAAYGGGGDLCLRGTLTNCTIKDNQGQRGGGLLVHAATVLIDGCRFIGNTATDGGGLYTQSDVRPTIRQSEFTSNYATGSGAGLFIEQATTMAEVTDSRFSHNRADGDGGGAFMQNITSAMIDGNLFSGNTALRWVGGLYLNNTHGSVTNNLITGNEAGSTVGALHLAGGSVMTVRGNVIAANKTGDDGGGIDLWASTAAIANNVIVGNTAQANGAGISLRGGSQVTLANNTVGWNQAQNVGGGLWVSESSSATVSSSILWHNIALLGAEVYVAPHCMLNAAYCNVPRTAPGFVADPTALVIWGQGNISGNPMFVRNPSDGGDGWGDDPATPDADEGINDDYGDLRVSPDSPCIDAGDPNFVAEPQETDLDGHARVLCDRVDMGAYEFGIGDFTCDHRVDLGDLRVWQSCITGPGGGPYAPGCEAFDFEFDGDVDLEDFAGFQGTFDGSGP
jgi:parallel beta-helix repeat protein/predicted outer membrane repeat protein